MEREKTQLDWLDLVSNIISHCTTAAGRSKLSEDLETPLKQTEIEELWDITVFFKQLSAEKKHLPLDEFHTIQPITHAAKVGRVLEGEDLRHIQHILDITSQCHQFLKIYGRGKESLEDFRNQLFPLESLRAKIESWVLPNGQLSDNASAKLTQLRSQIRNLRKRIENRLEYLMRHKPTKTYLQDHFFTIRSGKYVLPIRLDGHGRVPGRVIDTSASLETLFIHPSDIEELNHTLHATEVEEQIEAMRLLKELSCEVGESSCEINKNSQTLTTLDTLQARAIFAAEQKANIITLDPTATIELYEARHPLLQSSTDHPVVANDIIMGEHHGLVISGPNAGGKTVILKTVGLIYQMTRVGLLIPAASHSKMRLFDNIQIEIGDHQSLTSHLSTFSAHMTHIADIIENLDHRTLVLLDELGVGTEPETGAALAQAILEHLVTKKCTFLVTTHYESMKTLAIEDASFRNASMAYDNENIRPLYRLQLDIPGQSFGFDIATSCKIPVSIQQRARSLRGDQRNQLEDITQQLQQAYLATENLKKDLLKERQAVLMEKERWQQEILLHQQNRQNLHEQIRKNYQQLSREFRLTLRAFEKNPQLETKKDLQEKMEHVKQQTDETAPLQASQHELIPAESIEIGVKVLIVSLKQVGVIRSLPQGARKFVSVETKKGKLRVALQDLTWSR
ncbi:MAG: hypothetical protein AB8C84_03105 [Oligoflexales bacterium]